jgi:uncharacterized protein YraI/endonuclease/exonuclease/phosphatase family metal-dependent hydrolase
MEAPTLRKKSLIIVTAAVLLAALFASYAFAQDGPPDRVRVLRGSNLRGGPGTTFPVVGGAVTGAEFDVLGCNDACDWYQLEGGEWIAAFLVEAIEAPTPAPVTEAAPAAPTAVFLTVASWNVESGGSDPEVVADRIAEIDGIDLWGLSEVENDAWAAMFEAAAEEGENANFERFVSRSGRTDRLVILYDADRFEEIGRDELEYINLGGTIRAPILVHLRDRLSGQEFAFMVNHLFRGNDSDFQRRHDQAALLNEWALNVITPTIAVGDYNFDWDPVNGETTHDLGYDYMTADDVWVWVRPPQLVTTQCSGWPCRYNDVLDFVFVANGAQQWPARSEIVVTEGDFPDTADTPDHRLVLARFELPVVQSDSTLGPLDTPTVAPIATATPTTPPTVPPTATPTRTPTPAPVGFTPSPAEQAYVTEIVAIMDGYVDALNQLAAQMTAAGEDPLLIFDDVWKIRTAAATVALQLNGEELRKLQAPPRFAEVHAELLIAAGHYDRVATLVVEAIDELDVDKMTLAAAEMESANAAVLRAQALMEAATSATTTPDVSPSTPVGPTVASAANLRSGPGTSYSVIGSATAGQAITIVGQSPAGDWYLLDTGAWIAAFLVNNAVGPYPVIAPPPGPTQPPTAAPTNAPVAPPPTATPTSPPPPPPPTATPNGACDPSYPTVCIPRFPPDLDCGDIPYRRFQVVPPDPHRFDGDKDGIGCES